MKRSLAIGLTSLLLMALMSSANAQQMWLITPGKGWGPIVLGMEEQDALTILGTPTGRTDALGLHLLGFYGRAGLPLPPIILGFWQEGDGRYRLHSIDITLGGGYSVTREGIGLGSSLADVLRAYGDSLDNLHRSDVPAPTTTPGGYIVPGVKPRLSSCLVLSLHPGDGVTPPSEGVARYEHQWLSLQYPTRGIELNVWLSVPGQLPTVFRISVMPPDRDGCR